MTSKTNFINYFLLAFTLAFFSSGLSAGTLDFKDKKKDKEKKDVYKRQNLQRTRFYSRKFVMKKTKSNISGKIRHSILHPDRCV